MRYSAAVLDRVRDPRCAGTLAQASADVGTGEAGSLERGTLIRVQVRIDAGRVADAKFKAFGCSAAIASASFVAERVQGMTVPAARSLTAATVIESLDLPSERMHVADLAIEAARAALDDWDSGRSKDRPLRREGDAASGVRSGRSLDRPTTGDDDD